MALQEIILIDHHQVFPVSRQSRDVFVHAPSHLFAYFYQRHLISF